MVKFLCILLCLNLSFSLSQELDDDNIVSTASNPPLLPPPENHDKGPFKPSIHMIVGALIFTFSITFLVFLYVKHCKSGSNGYPSNSRGNIDNSYTARKNSGIDPNVIDLLPVFRFSALRGQKDGLECAVCLTNYEPSEVLRLLPKCKHAFHVECVDTWLDAHSTCPLCRYRVDPEDVLLIEHNKTLVAPQQIQPQVQDQEPVQAIHRTPGRHSSAGENITKTAKGDLQITVQKPPNASTSTRHSLDSSIISNKDVGSVSTKCFDKPPRRKDELLLAGKESRSDRRLQH